MTIGARAFSQKPSKDEKNIVVQTTLEDILSNVAPLKVILFGSTVSQNFSIGSDLDWLVVFKEERENNEGRKKLYRMKRRVPIPCDFVCVSEDRYDSQKDVGGIIYVAHHEGVVLFDKTEPICSAQEFLDTL